MRAFIFFSLVVLFLSSAQANTGHRLGGDIYFPENTLYSFEYAIKYLQASDKFHYAEFDVQESKDGYPVVFHDVKNIARIVPDNDYNWTILSRFKDGETLKNLRISDLYLDEIVRLKLENNARIPELIDVLNAAVDLGLNKPILVEIKSLKTDDCRQKTIDTVANYKNKLDINFLAFKSSFNKSFPDKIRWGAEFQKHNLKVFTAKKAKKSKNDLTKTVPIASLNWNFLTLVNETVFIKNKSTRVIQFPFAFESRDDKNYALNIGIKHGLDDYGDKGLYVHILDKNKNLLSSFFSKEKTWKWKTLNNLNTDEYIVSIEDKDTSFINKSPGNKAQIKVNLVEM
ncbi:hypothetical protein BCU84_03630 [Shewanella sp. 10N.286.51.B7]|uniref:glycerophosphodiester phosphodiesterase n=1 Tax=Shewanella sp. 10N.286.51.B7 TaxID=1880836 RepID=UPI000C82BDDE|nr:glycerophosphodiester phosphodiesterase family protein [Shewanella sp. 10N.286.51.B7]PMG80441.1 hypothetical protein BCU84_03630 [Shewanella sp. 10N.286.51.B7]